MSLAGDVCPLLLVCVKTSLLCKAASASHLPARCEEASGSAALRCSGPVLP